jgi:hypothetical protein
VDVPDAKKVDASPRITEPNRRKNPVKEHPSFGEKIMKKSKVR